MDNANDRAGRGWEGKESVTEEFTSYPGLMAAPGEEPAKSSKAHNSATPWFLPPREYVVLQPTDWHAPSLVAEMKRRQNEQ